MAAYLPSSEVPLATAGLGTNYDGRPNMYVSGIPREGPPLAHFGHSPPPTIGPSIQPRVAAMPVVPPTVGTPIQPKLAAMPAIHTSTPRNDLFTQRHVSPVAGKDDSMTRQFLKSHGVRHFLAYVFTLASFVIFAAPVVISITLASDNDVSFWIGRWGYLAILVPIFLFGQHLYHLWMLQDKSKLTRYLFIVTPILPAALFMFIGGTYMSYGRFLYGQLKSNDCEEGSGLPAKHYLQEAYDEAHDAWSKCVSRKKVENMNLPLRRMPTLQSCDEWLDLQKNSKSLIPWKGYKISQNSIRVRDPSNLPRWQYLANTELNHVCTGFCKRGPSLWTMSQKLGYEGSACGEIVAFRFLSVMHYGLMVFAMGAIVFVLSFPIYFSAKGFLGSLGYKSGTTLA